MNNLKTLADAVSAVSRFVENGAGTCDRDTVVDRVNEACERLMVKGDWPHTMALVRARVDNWTFPLPEEIEAIRAANVDNEATSVNSPYFRFMMSGPGEERSWFGTGAKFLDEIGTSCLMYDFPSIVSPGDGTEASETENSSGLYVMAFSTSPSDAAKKVTIRGLDRRNAEVSASEFSFVPSEDVQIVPWVGGEGNLTGTLSAMPMSSKVYRQLTGWSKPETAGYVSLYAVEPSTSRMWFLAKAHPYSTVPVWRRFRIRGQNCCGSNILIYGKLACRKLRADDDILPVQNVPSIKMMVQAIEFENKQQLQSAMEFESQAIRLLTEQKSEHDGQGLNVNVVDMDCDLFGAATSRYISR